MIDKRKIEAIDYLIEGALNKQQIAEKVGISERQFFRWLKDDDFNKEWQDRAVTVRNLVSKGFDAKLEKAKDKLWEIVCSDVDVRTREKALEYWINRALGTPTSKVETTVNDNKKTVDKSILDDVFNKNTNEE